MSQIILVRSPHGIVIASDSLVAPPHEAFPEHFPKVIHIGGYVFGACGAVQLLQMVVAAGITVGIGQLTESDVERAILKEYEHYCALPEIAADLNREISIGHWNASLVVVPPTGNIRLYEDGSPFQGKLSGRPVSSPIVLGPEPSSENTARFEIENGLRQCSDLPELIEHVHATLARTAGLQPASVGLPTYHVARTGNDFSLGSRPAASQPSIRYGMEPYVFDATGEDWMRPDKVARGALKTAP